MDLTLAQEVTVLFVSPIKSGPHSKGEVTAEHFNVWQKTPCPVGHLSIPQLVVASVIYGKRQMLALALPFS